MRVTLADNAMPDLVINGRITIPDRDLTWTSVRAGGPGGQNVNKVATKVELRFDLEATTALTPAVKSRLRAIAGARIDGDGVLILTNQETRSQRRNLELARAKLVELVAAALIVPKRRRPTKPSAGARRRRLADKRKRAEKKRARSKSDW